MRRRERDSARREKTPKRGVTDRALIRELFIQRVPLYPVADARRLTRTTQDEIDAAIADGAIATEEFGGQVVIPWDDVARLALERWTPRMMNGALGSTDRLSVVPLLNRVQQIEVFLPVYQIRLLHYLAETERGQFRARLNASDVLERHLLDLASAVDADELELAVPGFRAALDYPYFIPREDDWFTAFCWYCGRLSDVAGRQVCTDCHRRHEPRPHLGEDGIPELDQEE
ncbi:MAG TPA: hypothetical protein VEK11_01450 [Thermoanaerobaculia bacterium]|nr:hypothetical protein [Thermoanaerobaculia bacterium]